MPNAVDGWGCLLIAGIKRLQEQRVSIEEAVVAGDGVGAFLGGSREYLVVQLRKRVGAFFE